METKVFLQLDGAVWCKDHLVLLKSRHCRVQERLAFDIRSVGTGLFVLDMRLSGKRTTRTALGHGKVVS